MNDITGFLVDQLTEQFGLPAEDITPDSTFEQLGVDSLVLTEISMIIGNAFDVHLDDEDLSERHSIADLARRVAGRRAGHRVLEAHGQGVG